MDNMTGHQKWGQNYQSFPDWLDEPASSVKLGLSNVFSAFKVRSYDSDLCLKNRVTGHKFNNIEVDT